MSASIALVSGATGGIGLHIARQLTRQEHGEVAYVLIREFLGRSWQLGHRPTIRLRDAPGTPEASLMYAETRGLDCR
jgi:NAD(P)-dependent dehydrogenase (short-subunit alcohol dehydrogenase family)